MKDRVRVVKRTGWHELNNARVFVLPDVSIGPTANERFIVQGSATAPFESRGTLADWQNGLGSLVAGHYRAVFAVSIGFVGPLLNLVGREGSGFNLYGQSSRGKTTLAEASASVWGKGARPGFVRSWRSTANALEAIAALHTDTLLPLDELSVVDPREVYCAAYQLTAGTGKGRSARDGSLRQSLSWRTMVLSTGEVRIDDCGRFLDQGWANRAEAWGWRPLDLFGFDRERPLARYDQMGLLWIIQGRKLVALNAQTATIDTLTGSLLTHRRVPINLYWAVLPWELPS